MQQQLFQAPRGMRDFYPEDMIVRNRIFDAWRNAAEMAAFLPYDACVVESLDLLKRKAGEEIVDQIYAFKDKSGRDLALRPEMTPTLARMVSARAGSLSFPLKWSTIAQCFRYERMVRGRKREHYQWNLDIVGEESVQAEAEVLAVAFDALQQLGLSCRDVKVRINNRRLLSDLLARLDIPVASHPTVFLVLDKRGKQPDSQLSELLRAADLNDAVIARVFELLAIRDLADVASFFRDCPNSLEELHALFSLLETYEIRDAACFDISVIRGLAYYTGIVFEGFDVAGTLRAIFGGGRYNGLLSSIGGHDMPAVGLGFGDVVVSELLAEREETQGRSQVDLAIGYMQDAQRSAASGLAVRYRKERVRTDLALHAEKPKAFFSRADKNGARQAVFIGPDDVERGTARLKTLATREQIDITL